MPLCLQEGAFPGPAPFPAKLRHTTEAPPLPEAPPTGPQECARGPTPPSPARQDFWRVSLAPPLRRPADGEAGIAGTWLWGSCRRPAASRSSSEFALPPALRGAFPANAGRCRGTASRGSAPGTSRAPRPPWSQRVAGPGPTAAPRLTGWRSCCVARVGKEGPLGGLPRGRRRRQRFPRSRRGGRSIQTSRLFLWRSCNRAGSRVSTCLGIWCELSPQVAF